MNSETPGFVRQLRKLSLIACFLLVGVLSARGQKYEVTPLVGGMFGGTVRLERQGVPTFEAHLEDRLSYGIAGGIRFDADDCRNCDSIEFGRMRQNTHLALSQDPIVAPIIAPVFRPAVTLDHFLMHAELQRVVCTVGCIVALDGGVRPLDDSGCRGLKRF